MAESRGELEVYNQWFVAADLDRDGVLSGLEAVQFFQRSGLPQNPTLFKVWQYVAGDRPALSRQEFYTAMKLVSLAQLNGGQLDDQQALRLVNGLAGPLPLPRMSGMSIPRGIELPQHLLPREPAAAPQPAHGSQQTAPATTAPPPTRAAVPPASPPPAATSFPPLSGEQVAAFQTAFSQLDTDRDGYVQGTDCFGAFMQSGLPKASLKQIWDLVAGDEPRLGRHQFVQALYLIDCVKHGMTLPASLPPGQFPPVVGTANIAAMSADAPADIYSATVVFPPMVPRQTYQPQPQPPRPFASQVPGLPADRLAALDQADRMRLEAEREAALAAEAEQRKAEEERAAAAAKREFFTKALGDLRLTQSKVNRVVVEVQQRAEMERAAADQMEADYSRAYGEFSMAHAQSAPLVQALKQAQEEKAALTQKLESLRAMVAQLEEFDPEWESREKGECEALNKEIVGLTVRKEQLQWRANAAQAKRGTMVAHIEALKQAAAGVEAELAELTKRVDEVAAEGGKDKEAVVDLLKKVAPLYNKLYSAAKAAMVPLPAEALATVKREASPFQYDSLLVAAASDWGSFKDEGFKIVSALPVDTRLATFAPPSAAALEKDDAEAAAAPAPVAPAADGSGPAPAADGADPVQASTAATEGKALEGAGSVAESEAVSAAAEAGVLASAIAEALAGGPGSKGPSKQSSLAAGGSTAASLVAAAAEEGQEQAGAGGAAAAGAADESDGAAAANGIPFEVGFDVGSAEAEAPAAAVPVTAGEDAFAAFDSAPAAAAGGADQSIAAVTKEASGGAFGSTQALVVESPKAADAAVAAAVAKDGEAPAPPATSEKAPPPAAGDSWTAF